MSPRLTPNSPDVEVEGRRTLAAGPAAIERGGAAREKAAAACQQEAKQAQKLAAFRASEAARGRAYRKRKKENDR